MCAESGLPEADVQTGLANAGKSKSFVFRLPYHSGVLSYHLVVENTVTECVNSLSSTKRFSKKAGVWYRIN